MKLKTKIKYLYQYLTRGWSDKDLWSLDYTTAKFLLPRLKRFKKVTTSYPGNLSFEEWQHKLDNMIITFEIIANGDGFNPSEEECVNINKGLDDFREWFLHLWW